MAELTAAERACLARYCNLLAGRLGDRLGAVRNGPHFFSEAHLAAPDDERTREFLERIEPEACVVWPAA
jgi:hypothetical protein